MHRYLLRIKEIAKTYHHNGKPIKEALLGVTFDLYKGEVFALLGVNGAGKTTLSSIIASLHPPTSGDIFWDGKSIYKQLLEYRNIMGFCPQKPNIDKSLTLEESLIFSGRCYGLSESKVKERKDF